MCVYKNMYFNDDDDNNILNMDILMVMYLL